MTLRLLALGVDHWRDINGYAVAHNVQLKKLQVPDFLDYVWWWASRNRDQQDRDKLEQWVWRPPRGERAKTGPWSPQAESAAFQAFKAQAIG